MTPNVFAKWLKVVIVGTTLVGIACCTYVIPFAMGTFLMEYLEFSNWIIPWKILLYVCAIPCFVAMGISWKIAENIQHDKSFCMENARLFQIFSHLAIGDTVVFSIGSIVYFFCGMNHPGMVIVELLIVFAGMAVFVITAALSYLVAQAANLQEDSDLTI